MAEFKKLSDVNVIESMTDGLNVLVENNGEIEKIAANNMIPEDVALKSDIPTGLVKSVNGEVPDEAGNVAVSGFPEGAAAHQQLVTDAEGNVQWEEKLAYSVLSDVVIKTATIPAGERGMYRSGAGWGSTGMRFGAVIIDNNRYDFETTGDSDHIMATFSPNLPEIFVVEFYLDTIVIYNDSDEEVEVQVIARPAEIKTLPIEFMPSDFKAITSGEGEGAEIFNDSLNNVASGGYSHAEGNGTTASGNNSHAEGYSTTASEASSHAEGNCTTASGFSSHTEGYSTTASGNHSHAEGEWSAASGNNSHAEGFNTAASGENSHTEGSGTIAAGSNQHVQGACNIIDNENKYAHIVGNGENEDNRSNAHTLDWEGNAWFAGTVEGTGIIIQSPNGTRYQITVSDDGTLTASAVTE